MITVYFTPAEIASADLTRAQVVVIDVLRASSTIATALASGAREVRLFDAPDAARAARDAHLATGAGPAILAGEQKCLRIEGFDCGNSPAEFQTHVVGNATVFLSTSNGTRAAVAAQRAGARRILVGGLLNAAATARALVDELDAGDTVLLCAGTHGQRACEDALGAGAILFSLLGQTYRPDLPFTDMAWLAYHAFTAVRPRLNAALRLGQGGINVIEAGLEDDIDRCAAIDTRPIPVGVDAALCARRIS